MRERGRRAARKRRRLCSCCARHRRRRPSESDLKGTELREADARRPAHAAHRPHAVTHATRAVFVRLWHSNRQTSKPTAIAPQLPVAPIAAIRRDPSLLLLRSPPPALLVCRCADALARETQRIDSSQADLTRVCTRHLPRLSVTIPIAAIPTPLASAPFLPPPRASAVAAATAVPATLSARACHALPLQIGVRGTAAGR